jgi:hypothetical protein
MAEAYADAEGNTLGDAGYPHRRWRRTWWR